MKRTSSVQWLLAAALSATAACSAGPDAPSESSVGSGVQTLSREQLTKICQIPFAADRLAVGCPNPDPDPPPHPTPVPTTPPPPPPPACAPGVHCDPNDPIYRTITETTDLRCKALYIQCGQPTIDFNNRMKEYGCLKEEERAIVNQKGIVSSCRVGLSGALEFVGACQCGCFAPETELSVEGEDGHAAAATALSVTESPKSFRLMTLADSSSLAAPELVSRAIVATSKGPESNLHAITVADGRTLRVTGKHGIVLASGKVVPAKDVAVGDQLVDASGKPIAVSSVRIERHGGNVYNVETESTTKEGHLVVAQGLLVGDLAWQNALLEEERAVREREGN